MADTTHYISNDVLITAECQRTDTTLDISGGETFYIKYLKPDGTAGSWTGSLSGTHQITYQAGNTDIDQSGIWKFRAYVTYANGREYQGDPVPVNIRKIWQTRD